MRTTLLIMAARRLVRSRAGGADPAGRSGASTFYEREVSDQRVEPHGDVAITTGQVRVRRQHADPTRAEYTIWYVRVYRLNAGAWRLLSHQTVRSNLPTG